MTDDTQPEAMDLADWLEAVGGGPSAKRCAALLREQHARIAELESELEAVGAGGVSGPLMGSASLQSPGFDAADMATASAQGFRDGVASLRAALAASPTPPAESPIGEVVVTKDEDGQIVAVTRQDDEGRILSVIATSGPAEQQAASSAVLKAIREANMQLVRTGDDAFMLVPYKVATPQAESVTAPGGGVVAAGRFMDEAAERRSAQEGYENRIKRVSERNPHDEGMYSLGWWDRAWKAAAPTPPAQAADSVLEDAARLDWLEQNIFHREMDEWDSKVGGRGNQNMWVLFAPKGVQGSARKIIDAARKQGGA